MRTKMSKVFPTVLLLITLFQNPAKANDNISTTGDVQADNISFKEFYYSDSDEVDEMLATIESELQQNPNNVNAITSQGRIFVFQKKFNEARAAFNKLAYVDATQTNYVFFQFARIYALENNVNRATYSLYEILQKNVDAKLLSEIEDTFLIFLTDDEQKQYELSSSRTKFIYEFLKKNDPSPATIENEFIVDLFQRYDYALRNFQCLDFVDDRGKIYLQFGEPNERKIFPHTSHETECWIYYSLAPEPVYYDFIRMKGIAKYELVTSLASIPGDKWINILNAEQYDPNSIRIDDNPPSEYFFADRRFLLPIYNDVYNSLVVTEVGSYAGDNDPRKAEEAKYSKNRLKMTNSFMNLNTRVENEIAMNDYQFQIKTQQEELTETVPNQKRFVFDLDYDIARFKDDDNKIRVETYFGFPLDIARKLYLNNFTSHITLTEQYAVKDTMLNHLTNFKKEDVIPFPKVESAYYENSQSLSIVPGKYVLAMELSDNNDMFHGKNETVVDNTNFLSEDLFMSDVQLSSEIRISTSSNINVKNGLYIKPYPYRKILRNSPFYIYAEIYNLKSVENHTQFEVTYTIENVMETNLLDDFLSLFKDDKQPVSFTQMYDGNSNNDFIYFQVDCSNLESGPTKLSIKVKDLWSGKEFTRDKFFTLVE